MEYRVAGNRCAVRLDNLELPISNKEALTILERKGFAVIDVDIIEISRQCIGMAQYRRGARPSEAPAIVDCSSLIKWLYGQRGIWLPRRSIQQRELGESVDSAELIAGDVVFVSGWIDYYLSDPSDGVGHVGIVTGDKTIIHAANSKAGVIENSIPNFIDNKFRGARRYIPKDKKVITLEVPIEREVETEDDIRWIILQSMGNR